MNTDYLHHLELVLGSLHDLLDRIQSGDSEDAPLSALPQTTECSNIHSQLAQILHHLQSEQELLLLSDIADLLARAVSTRQVLEAIVDGLKKITPYDAAGIFLLDEYGSIEAEVLRGYAPDRHDLVHVKVNEGIIGWVVANATAAIVPDVEKDERYVDARRRTSSEMAVPIISGGDVVGCMNLESDNSGQYSEADLPLLEDMAAQAAVAIDRAKTYHALLESREREHELEIARRIQQTLLPQTPPEFQTFDIFGHNVSSKAVGGDYFDFIRITPDDLGIVIADVSGKGVPAGLIMSGLRGALRSKIETTYSIDAIIQQINRFLYESTGPESFVTAFYGVLNRKSGIFTYVNAGHNPPPCIRSDGSTEWLSIGGPLLGVLPKGNFETGLVKLEPGDIIAMYTDGIEEAGVQNGEEFGAERVVTYLKDHASESAKALALGIEQASKQWINNRGGADDRTVVVVKRT